MSQKRACVIVLEGDSVFQVAAHEQTVPREELPPVPAGMTAEA